MKISKETVWGGVKKTLWFLFCVVEAACFAVLILLAAATFLFPVVDLFKESDLFWNLLGIGCVLLILFGPLVFRLHWSYCLLNLAIVAGSSFLISLLPVKDPTGGVLQVLLAVGLIPWLLITVYLTRYLFRREG